MKPAEIRIITREEAYAQLLYIAKFYIPSLPKKRLDGLLNLLILTDFVSKLDDDNFYYENWITRWSPIRKHCETIACIGGWGHFVFKYSVSDKPVSTMSECLFDLGVEERRFVWDGRNRLNFAIPKCASRSQAVAHVRKFIAVNGFYTDKSVCGVPPTDAEVFIPTVL